MLHEAVSRTLEHEHNEEAFFISRLGRGRFSNQCNNRSHSNFRGAKISLPLAEDASNF
jgi:hypothetical protein